MDFEDYNQRLCRCDNQDRAAVLVQVLEDLSDHDANRLLAEWFNTCDAIGEHAEALGKHFDRAGFVTDVDPYRTPAFPTTVYRAGWADTDPEEGLSWTLSKDVALRFCRGLFSMRAWFLGIRRDDVNGIVWQATCLEGRGYLEGRGELEVIPKKLVDIEQILEVRRVKE